MSVYAWPCFHERCAKPGNHVIRIEYGDQAEHRVGIRLCKEHRDSFRAWFEVGARLTLAKVYALDAGRGE